MAQTKFGPHVEQLFAVAGEPSAQLLAVAGRRDTAQVEGSQVHVTKLAGTEPLFSADVDAAACALAFVADKVLVAGTTTGELWAWDSGEKAPRATSFGRFHHGPVAALAAAGSVLASVGHDGKLCLFDLSGKKPKLTLRGQRSLSDRALRAVAIDPDGVLVAGAGDDNVIRSVRMLDVAEGDVRQMPCGEEGIGVICFSGDGRIVAGCGDGSVRVCYLEGAVDEEDRSGKYAHERVVRSLLFGPQLYDKADRPLPRRLFSAAEDGNIKSWELDSRRRPRTIEVGGGGLRGMVWLPAPARVKAGKKGGTLAAITARRQVALIRLDQASEQSGDVVRIESEIARLTSDLRARADKVRLAAVKTLGTLPEDDARKLLDRALSRDNKPDVRKAAAKVIGDTGRRLSRPTLRKALNDQHKSVRRAALAALTTLEHDTPLSPVRAALSSNHPDTRAEAVKRLPRLRAESPLVPGLVADALRDNDAKVRTAALDALFALEAKGSLAPVRTALLRGPADVRADALLRLGYAKQALDPEGAGLLEGALDDEDGTVRGFAYLVAVGARAKLARRLALVDPHTRKALGDLRKKGTFTDEDGAGKLTEADLQPLFAAMACRHPDTALRGARCLALLGDSRATGALIQLSREPQVEIRRFVVEALQVAAMALPGDGRLTTRLQWLMDDADAQVRSLAFSALVRLASPEGHTGVLDLAERALRCGHEDMRVRALQLLVGFGGGGKRAKVDRALADRADTLLGDALDDEDSGVRNEAFRTLWAWHSKSPRLPIERAAKSRHADIRRRVVRELERQKARWSDAALLTLIADASPQVGLAALRALTDEKANKKKALANREKSEVHLAALTSPRAEVRTAGCKAARRFATYKDVRARLLELLREEHESVHLAAIEAVDRLEPTEPEAFELAFSSIHYGLRVRAGELCGKRRDVRAVAPMTDLLTIPKSHINRPNDQIRQRAARALADVADPGTIRFYVELLTDEDETVREMGARGLATACRPGEEKPLLDALSHGDLAVRSWAAEGLARLGDARAVPVLAGTLTHTHRPIRLGAILSFVALGPDGVPGFLQGLEDPDREIQDLVFAVVAARDMALARAGHKPDLLLSALASSKPEIRYAAGRLLEARTDGQDIAPVARELVGPRRPDRAADMKKWPSEADQQALLNVLVDTLAADHPSKRYAAARVLSLRNQPLSFWREARWLRKPQAVGKAQTPYTNWDDEQRQPRRKDWLRRLFGQRASSQAELATERVLTVIKFVGSPSPRAVPPEEEVFDGAEVRRLVFGTYAGLIRQAPAPGEADETHRVRRDCIQRLSVLAGHDDVGRDAVLPVFRRAISDPNHLVRKAAVTALRGLYPQNDLTPLGLCLESSAADVGRAAVDELIAAAEDDGPVEARNLAIEGLAAPNAEVRAYTLGRLPRLYDEGSLDPWLVALSGRHADVRLAVVDRLMDLRDERVTQALSSAMESDHEDLRLKAASALARRGDTRTVDVLAAFLRSEERRVASEAVEVMVSLVHARPTDAEATERAGKLCAEAIALRLEDDPDRTADRGTLMAALGRIAHPAAGPVLLELLADKESFVRQKALAALLQIAVDSSAVDQVFSDGTRRKRYQEPLLLGYVEAMLRHTDVSVKLSAVAVLRDVDDPAAEAMLARLVDDRDEQLRVAATEALAFRAEHVEGATVVPLQAALRSSRRELVLPAAAGLAAKRKPESFQALMLVFKAGQGAERERAVLGLGTLGDARALEDLEPILDPAAEIEEEDRALAPAVVEALGRMLPHLDDPDVAGRIREVVERTAVQGRQDMRLRALTGLRHAGDDRSRTKIEAVVSDRYDDTWVRRHAVDQLGLLRNEGSEAVLAEVLTDDDHNLRKTALKALSRVFPDDRTRTSLLALRSRHGDVTKPAARYLALRGDPKTLLRRMPEVRDPAVRRQLRLGLVRRGECPQKEVSELLSGTSVGARAEAAWIAGAAAESRLGKAVTEAVKLSSTQWAEAHKAMAGVDPGGKRKLDRIAQAWLASLWAASRVKAKGALQPCRATLGDATAPAGVKVQALRFVARFGDANDLSAVQGCLSDPDAGVRAAAASTAAALAPERSADAVAQLAVGDSAALDPMVRQALPRADLLHDDAVRRLALPVLLGDGRAEELVALATTPNSKDPKRLTAIAALGRMGGDEARAALEWVLSAEGEPKAVLQAAYSALRRVQRAAAVSYEEGQDKETGRYRGGWGYSGYSSYDDDDDDDDYDDYDDEDY